MPLALVPELVPDLLALVPELEHLLPVLHLLEFLELVPVFLVHGLELRLKRVLVFLQLLQL